MLTRQNMAGLFVLLITPMDQDFRIDYSAHRDNVRKLVALGVDGIILNGTNGEFHTCTDEERERLTTILVEEAKGKAFCIAGCSSVNTADAIRRTRRAAELGADGVMNTLPYYLPPSKAESIQYFRDLAEACPNIGIIVYNNPYTTQVLLNDDDFLRLQEIPNFCGSKMVGADLALYLNCLRKTAVAHFPLEQLWGISSAVGGTGVMASFLYACPQYMMRWWQAIRGKDLERSLKMQHEVNQLLEEVVLPPILAGTSEVAATKGFVDAIGAFRAGPSRKPYFPLGSEAIQDLRRKLEVSHRQFLQ